MSSEIRTMMPVESEAQRRASHQLGMARKGLCPFCGSTKVREKQPPDELAAVPWQVELPYCCGDCDGEWTGVFEMIRVEEV